MEKRLIIKAWKTCICTCKWIPRALFKKTKGQWIWRSRMSFPLFVPWWSSWVTFALPVKLLCISFQNWLSCLLYLTFFLYYCEYSVYNKWKAPLRSYLRHLLLCILTHKLLLSLLLPFLCFWGLNYITDPECYFSAQSLKFLNCKAVLRWQG